MDPATRLKRHAQLWSAGEANARRIGIGGAIFALIILLTVIEPFHMESSKTRGDIDARQNEAERLQAELQTLADIQAQLSTMSRRIDSQPWTDEIETLKRQFRAGEISDPVRQSNAALDAIADELRKDVIEPLANASARLPDDNPLANVPATLDEAVAEWLNRYQRTNWWITRDAKNDTAEAIGRDLSFILSDASREAATAIDRLRAAARDTSTQLARTRSDIEALVEKLTGVMDRALPAWARGIIDVEQLLILFPLVVAAIAAYLLVTAVRASRLDPIEALRYE